MREALKNFYYHSAIGRAIIHPFIWLRNVLLPEKLLLKSRFKRMLGYELNLKNPKSLNEKIQWLKLNDRSDLHVKCADKYAVRDHIREKIGESYLIPLILATDQPASLSKDDLPDYPVIIKPNHGSGGVTIIRDKSAVDWEQLTRRLKRQLSYSYANGKVEWQYQRIKPMLVVEKLMIDKDGCIPNDYKFHCMNGKVAFIQVDMDRETNHKKNLYDPSWNFIDCKFNYDTGRPVEKPEALDDMNKIAEKLSKEFIYVRVDLYLVDSKIYFGELTFHPASGFGWFDPAEWDFKFGEMLELPV